MSMLCASEFHWDSQSVALFRSRRQCMAGLVVAAGAAQVLTPTSLHPLTGPPRRISNTGRSEREIALDRRIINR